MYLPYFCYIVTLFGLSICNDDTPYYQLNQRLSEYHLPKLGFSETMLEPYIDRATVENHHQGHHEAYRKKMNAALANWRKEAPEDLLATESPITILKKLNQVPEKFKTAVRNNGGGFVNHCFYWAVMSPNPDNKERMPGQTLIDDITDSFSSYEGFKEAFNGKALTLFGSGYVWLIRRSDESLAILTSTNQDSPISSGDSPILVLDLWEHAYYLKHQFRRAAHLQDWWMVVDWEKVDALDQWWRLNTGGDREEL